MQRHPPKTRCSPNNLSPNVACLAIGLFLAGLAISAAQFASPSPTPPQDQATNAQGFVQQFVGAASGPVNPAASPSPPDPASSPAADAAPMPAPVVRPTAPAPYPIPAPTSSSAPVLTLAPFAAPAATPPLVVPPPPPAPTPSVPHNVPLSTPPLVRGAIVHFPTPAGVRADEPLVRFGRPAPTPDYGNAGNRELALLRSRLDRQDFTFDRSSLRDVLRLLAEEAKLPYIGIPEHSPKAQRLVTFQMKNIDALSALENVARQNDIKLTYNDGVMFMRVNDPEYERRRIAEDENELLGVLYELKNTPLMPVFSIETGSGNQSGFRTQVTVKDSPGVINEIRSMLGLPPVSSPGDPGSGGAGDPGPAPSPAPLINVGGQNDQNRPDLGQLTPLASYDGMLLPRDTNSQGVAALPSYIPPEQAQVVYNPSANVIWVVATRKQHSWVREYLSKVDRAEDLIAVEVKFFETKKNPQTDFGINWEDTFGGDGLKIRGQGTIGSTNSLNTSGQSAPELGGFTLAGQPYSAVLSVDQASVALQAFSRDRNSSLVQYPRALTVNNREVTITAQEQTPVNSGTVTVQAAGSSSAPVGTLDYISTGTQVFVLPKVVGKNQIAMNVYIDISSIIGFEPINLGTGTSEYPVTSSRNYSASLTVNSGYTLAVGGLVKVDEADNQGGIPILKDIPVAGYLFKNKSRNRSKVNLIIFITPYIISDQSVTPGLSEDPESTVPVRPGVPPPAPNFAPSGFLIGGEKALPGALAWLEYQLRYFKQINKESRDDAESIGDLRSVIQRARSLSDGLQTQVLESAGYAPPSLVDSSARADALLFELNKILAAAQLDQFQLQQGFP